MTVQKQYGSISSIVSEVEQSGKCDNQQKQLEREVDTIINIMGNGLNNWTTFVVKAILCTLQLSQSSLLSPTKSQ
jgi:hypothetical protein